MHAWRFCGRSSTQGAKLQQLERLCQLQLALAAQQQQQHSKWAHYQCNQQQQQPQQMVMSVMMMMFRWCVSEAWTVRWRSGVLLLRALGCALT
jgi:hypothetical protein